MSREKVIIQLPNLYVTKNDVVVPVERAIDFVHYNDDYVDQVTARVKTVHEYEVQGELGTFRFKSEKELDSGLIVSRIITLVANHERDLRKSEQQSWAKCHAMMEEIKTLKAHIFDLNERVKELTR